MDPKYSVIKGLHCIFHECEVQTENPFSDTNKVSYVIQPVTLLSAQPW